MKIKSVVKPSTYNRKHVLNSSVNGRIYTKFKSAIHHHAPAATFRKNGAQVHCKHLFFMLIFILKVEEKDHCLRMKHLEDDDLKVMLQYNVDSLYLLKIGETPSSRKTKDYQAILKKHTSYSNDQTFILHHKTTRSAKCSGRNCR